jgi:H+-translocating NAD(P) transhydrogenase subunit alpha
MVIAVLKEPSFENRVIITPDIVALWVKLNYTVIVEQDAGLAASYQNDSYSQAGAIITNRIEAINKATIICAIHIYDDALTCQNKILVGQYQANSNAALMASWLGKQHTVFSMEKLPRTTRAQSMDVLSSQANIAGYKAVVLAAQLYPRYIPMFITAAGSIKPAKVLILGAGVAGLQAIATAKRLGAVVEVFDTRPAVKEEVQSLGAKFIEVEGAADASAAGGYAVEQTDAFKQLQQNKIAESIAKADIVITTAQIPGKQAPILITETMLNTMRHGSVIVDIAASTGGNTPKTENNKTVNYNGVTIAGYSNLPSSMASDASKLYAKNIYNFISLLINKEGVLDINLNDDLVAGCKVNN